MIHWTHWSPKTLPSLPRQLRHWLSDTGSLTRRYQALCEQYFHVELLEYDWQPALPEESRFLSHDMKQLMLEREVLLCDGDRAEIYARTVIPPKTYQEMRARFDNLGNKPLGQMLFDDPTLKRGPIEVARLGPSQWLFQLAIQMMLNEPTELWARRSCFYLNNKPLMVTEIFLPSKKWNSK